jgi:hypothetical protein
LAANTSACDAAATSARLNAAGTAWTAAERRRSGASVLGTAA